jgi:hypothetical protein
LSIEAAACQHEEGSLESVLGVVVLPRTRRQTL